jgi:hypothetical protein
LAKLGFQEELYLHKKEFNTNKEALIASPKIVTKSNENAAVVAKLIKNNDKKGLIAKINGMTNAELLQMKKAFNKIQTSNNLDKDFDYWLKKTLTDNYSRGSKVQSPESQAILDRVKNLETVAKSPAENAGYVAALIGKKDDRNRQTLIDFLYKIKDKPEELNQLRIAFNKKYPSTLEKNKNRNFDGWIKYYLGDKDRQSKLPELYAKLDNNNILRG